MKYSFTVLALLMGMCVSAQTLSGTVVNEQQEPIPYALISAGTHGQVLSNEQGAFELQGAAAGTEIYLQVRHLGYQLFQDTIYVNEAMEPVKIVLQKDVHLLRGVEVSVLRADARTPFAESTVTREMIERMDVGVDMPYLMDLEPSVVTTSDAGTGIGYTGMRVRGSDPTRVNVTINGVPLNDAESSTVFWVDLPDLAASTNDIQIQRGVGTSTNGPGAFGASVNLQTASASTEGYAQASAFGGSFNTRKFNVAAGTGTIGEHFSFDARLSNVQSDGFIDRATAAMTGYYLQGAWRGKKSSLRLIGFGGHEETYQAWYGVPGEVIDTNRTYNFYSYDNEVDNYGQQHYQLLFDHALSENTQFNLTLYRTDGAGYFEQYKDEEDLADYGISPLVIDGVPTQFDSGMHVIGGDTLVLTSDSTIAIGGSTIESSDIIRRRWLDNTLMGANASVQTTINKVHRLVVGAGYSKYEGAHFGEVIWAQYAVESAIRDRYYDNDASKADATIYAKYTHALSSKTDLFADLQYRTVNYDFLGIDDDGTALNQRISHGFFNPKAGITFRPKAGLKAYASVAVGNKEPNRTDYTESAPDNQPEHEELLDYELGVQCRTAKRTMGVNFYYMDYTNQLVLTGELNDVGGTKRVNVPESYRAGVELAWGFEFLPWLNWRANAAFSANKIKRFTEFVDADDADFNYLNQEEIEYEESDIAFSPNVVAGSELAFRVWEKKLKGSADIALVTKYVGKQFLDNTGNDAVVLDPWLVNDLRLNLNILSLKGAELSFTLAARNVLNHEYESNGWSYPHFVAGERTQSIGLYPQAGRNFLGGLSVKF